ncbi:MAG: hypothetical protein V3T72_00310 [Thermoanaerobaculia bacterium]
MALQDQWGRREKPFQRAAILAVAVGLVGFLIYRQVDRWRGEEVTVWVAASNLEAVTVIAAESLSPIQVRERQVPEGTVLERRSIQGWQLLQRKQQGVAFFDGDLARPPRDPGPGLAEMVPAGRVLMTLELPGLPVLELAESLRLGDRFDIFTYGRTQSGPAGPIVVARNVIFLGWIQPRGPEGNGESGDEGVAGGMFSNFLEAAGDVSGGAAGGGGGPSPFLLGVRPEDVNRMVWTQSTRGPLSLVIHGQTEVKSGELLHLPEPRPFEIELITGARRQKLPIR